MTVHRQHSYTSSLPQLGNGSPRGDYASYAIADTSSAARSRGQPSVAAIRLTPSEHAPSNNTCAPRPGVL
jgi:hypothetical protein